MRSGFACSGTISGWKGARFYRTMTAQPGNANNAAREQMSADKNNCRRSFCCGLTIFCKWAQLLDFGSVAVAGGFLAKAALPTEAAVEQMRHDQQSGTDDAEGKFRGAIKTFTAPCDGEDKTHAHPNQGQQRFAPMYGVSGNEASKSEQNDADSKPSVEGCVPRKIGDDVGEEADDDRRQQAVNHADGRGGGSGNVSMAMNAAKGHR